MNKEIGSEFWEAPLCRWEGNGLFQPNVQWFLCGRSALQAIISELKNKKTVAMPSWCCHTMIKPFIDAGIDVKFYPVCNQDGFFQEIDLSCDIVYVMDYFGFSSNMQINHPCIIRDVTHSLFSKSYRDADYYYGSLRKWCGIWTGGYAWTSDGHLLTNCTNSTRVYSSLREKAMDLKERYISDPCNHPNDKSEFLDMFKKAECYLENCMIEPAEQRDIKLAQKLDVDFIQRRRRANAKILMTELKDYVLFKELDDGDTPLFVPIIVPNSRRDELRNYLVQNSIYCPCHWPLSSYHTIDNHMKELYDNEISLVCDQRYSEDDMYRIAYAIKRFINNNSMEGV